MKSPSSRMLGFLDVCLILKTADFADYFGT